MKCWFRRRWIKTDFLSPSTFVSSRYFSVCLRPAVHSPELSLPPLNAGKSILLTVFHGTSIFFPCSLVVCVPLWSPLLDYQPSQKQSLRLLHFLGLLSLLTTACGTRLDDPMDGCKLSDVGSFILGPSIALRIQNGSFPSPHFSPAGWAERMKRCHFNPIFCQCC